MQLFQEERDKLLNTLAELQAGSSNQLADRAVENQPKINAVKEFFEPPVTSTVTPLPSVHPVPVAPRQQVGVSPNGRAPATGGESQHPYVGTLPGASKHPILNYNDEQLKQTQINDMISLYALTTGRTPGVSCDSDFGMGLVHRWREAKAEYCSADAARVGTVGGKKSEIDCYLVKQTRHGGNGDQICVMENVGVNMDIFNDDKIMYNTVRSYEATKHRAQPYVKFPSDFIKAACKPNPDKWKPSLMPGWNNGMGICVLPPRLCADFCTSRLDCLCGEDHSRE